MRQWTLRKKRQERAAAGPTVQAVVKREGEVIICPQLLGTQFPRNGHDWADRFPAIVDAASRIQAQSFLIDGEAVITRDDGMPDFHALRGRRRGHERRCCTPST